jgi:hypothetical protein
LARQARVIAMPSKSDSDSYQGGMAQFKRDVVVLKSVIAATLAMLVVIVVMVVRVVIFLG